MESKAVWAPIIPEPIFFQVQDVLNRVYGSPKNDMVKKYPFFISGLLRCGECGKALVGKSAHGRYERYEYYEHAWLSRKQGCLKERVAPCKTYRVKAKIAEEQIWQAVTEILQNPDVQKALLEQAKHFFEQDANAPEKARLQHQIGVYDQQLAVLAERLAELPASVSAQPIYTQMQKVEDTRTKDRARLFELEAIGNANEENIVHLATYKEFLDGLKTLTECPLEKLEPPYAERLCESSSTGSRSWMGDSASTTS